MEIFNLKWKLPIIWYLHEKNSTRYNELQRRIPKITKIMLTKSLRELEADGLIERKIFDDNPPKHIEYFLTQTGWNLIPTLIGLYDCGLKHMQKN